MGTVGRDRLTAPGLAALRLHYALGQCYACQRLSRRAQRNLGLWDRVEIQPTPRVLFDEAMLDLHEIRHRWRSAPEVLLHGKLQSLVTTA